MYPKNTFVVRRWILGNNGPCTVKHFENAWIHIDSGFGVVSIVENIHHFDKCTLGSTLCGCVCSRRLDWGGSDKIYYNNKRPIHSWEQLVLHHLWMSILFVRLFVMRRIKSRAFANWMRLIVKGLYLLGNASAVLSGHQRGCKWIFFPAESNC